MSSLEEQTALLSSIEKSVSLRLNFYYAFEPKTLSHPSHPNTKLICQIIYKMTGLRQTRLGFLDFFFGGVGVCFCFFLKKNK